jgi:8-oxo-dGTP pyrophosphatase MutT (NUDIX family)
VSVGPTEQQALQRKALGHAHHGYWVAGIRESFEEAGLLLAYDQSGELVRYDTPERARRFAAMREPLHAGTLSLFEICAAENLRLAIDAIHFHNRVVTPLGRPRRFDTRFFIAEAPAGQTGVHDDFETVDSVWVSPQEALRRHADQEFGLMRVTQMQLEELALHNSGAALLSAAAARNKFSVLRPKLPRD